MGLWAFSRYFAKHQGLKAAYHGISRTKYGRHLGWNTAKPSRRPKKGMRPRLDLRCGALAKSASPPECCWRHDVTELELGHELSKLTGALVVHKVASQLRGQMKALDAVSPTTPVSTIRARVESFQNRNFVSVEPERLHK